MAADPPLKLGPKELGALHGMLVDRVNYTLLFDGAEAKRLERYFREQAKPAWEKANNVMPGHDPEPLTMEEALHALVIDALEVEEREAGYIGTFDGTFISLQEEEARHRARIKHDGKRLPLRVRWKQIRCSHPMVTYHGHPDAPNGLCLECGKVWDG